MRCHIDQRLKKIEEAVQNKNEVHSPCSFLDEKLDILNEVDRTAMYFRDETDKLKGNVNEIERKLESCIVEQKELKDDVENLKNGLEDLKDVVKVIEEKQTQNEEHSQQIVESVEELREENDSLQQYGRRETLVIHNVPKYDDENTLQVALSFISNELGLNISQDFVSTCHRNYPPKNTYAPSCPPIYIKFTRRDLKRECLRRKLKLKGRKNEQGYHLYITENLTLYRRNLLADVNRELHYWKFIWTKNGNIWARKNENCRAVMINTHRVLDKVVYEEGEESNNY